MENVYKLPWGYLRLFLLYPDTVFFLPVCCIGNYTTAVPGLYVLIAEVTGVSPCFSPKCHLSTVGAGSGGEGLSLAEGGVRGAGLKPISPQMLTYRTQSRSEAISQ